jgi:serine/threonine-protein kinase
VSAATSGATPSRTWPARGGRSHPSGCSRRWPRAARKHGEGLAIAQEVVGEANALAYRPLLAEALVVRGDLEDASGDYEAARASLHDGLWLADACRDDDLLARAMSSLMTVVGSRQAKFEEALRWRPHADAVVMRAGEGTTIHAMLLGAVGTTLFRQGRTGEALPVLAQRLAIVERNFAPDDRVVLDAVRDLGNAQLFYGQPHEAQALYRRALTIAEETYGPQHPEIARLALNLGGAHLSANEFDEAKGPLERALAISGAALGP